LNFELGHRITSLAAANIPQLKVSDEYIGLLGNKPLVRLRTNKTHDHDFRSSSGHSKNFTVASSHFS